jgi:hypothetical protein
VASRVRYAILDDAGDEAPLWELTWALSELRDGSRIEIHPPMTIDEVRRVLEELLRDGHVSLFVMDDPQGPLLALDDALQTVGEDANWTPPATSGQDRAYALVLTDSGEAEYRAEYEAQKA